MSDLPQFPHCDTAVLHAPGECSFCDRHPDWQQLRHRWGIAYTGHPPTAGQLPCPADHARGLHQAHTWGGNRPTTIDVPVPQTPASRLMYGNIPRRFHP